MALDVPFISYRVNVEYTFQSNGKFIYLSLQPIYLSFYFPNNGIIVSERVEKYTFFDFLAICGGLLGLFLGISLLSIIELIYYSTLRLFWTIRRWKSEVVTVPSVPLNPRWIDVIPIEDHNE